LSSFFLTFVELFTHKISNLEPLIGFEHYAAAPALVL